MKKLMTWLAHITMITLLSMTHSVMAAPAYRIIDLGAVSLTDYTGKTLTEPGIMINDASQVALNTFTEDVFSHAFRLGPNQVLNPALDDLGALGHNPFTTALNHSGQVVGYYSVNVNNQIAGIGILANGESHVFRLDLACNSIKTCN